MKLSNLIDKNTTNYIDEIKSMDLKSQAALMLDYCSDNSDSIDVEHRRLIRSNFMHLLVAIQFVVSTVRDAGEFDNLVNGTLLLVKYKTTDEIKEMYNNIFGSGGKTSDEKMSKVFSTPSISFKEWNSLYNETTLS